MKRRTYLRSAVLVALMLQLAAPLAAQEPVQWRNYTINPDGSSDELSANLRSIDLAPAETDYYFVQFKGPITEEAKARVEKAGAELLTFTRPSTFIARIAPGQSEAIAALPGISWVGIYQPAFKISQDLARRSIQPRSEDVKPRIDPVHPEFQLPDQAQIDQIGLTVQVFLGEDLGKITEAIEKTGGTVLSSNRGALDQQLRITIALENLSELARINGVLWIEQTPVFKLDNNTGRSVIGVPEAWTAPEDLRGSKQIIAVGDTGIDTGVDNATMHDDVEGRIVNIFSTTMPLINIGCGLSTNAGADDGASDLDSGHGTHVTGSVLGNGTLSGGTYSGVAPEAELVFQALEQFGDFPGTDCDGYGLYGIPNNLNDLFQQAYDAGARIHTNSWNSSINLGGYSVNSQAVDNFVWNNPDMFILYSASNNGSDADGNGVVDSDSIGSPGTAKNALTVGASENNRPTINQTYNSSYGAVIDTDQITDNPTGLAAFSGRGPTDDGRIKPDVVAPGTLVISTRSSAGPNAFLFADDMESGLNGWTGGGTWTQSTADAHSGTTSWTDSPVGNHGQGQNITLLSPVINISGGGLAGDSIRFWLRYDLGDGDQFILEVSRDGGTTWSLPIPFTNTQTDWELVTIGLGPFADSANFRVRFRLVTDNDGDVGDGVWLDDVQVVEGAFLTALTSDFGISTPGDAIDTSYLMSNGTSMATPLTAGSAALVREYFTEKLGIPYVSAALLRATIMNGATDTAPGQYGTGTTQEYAVGPNNATGWGRVHVGNSVLPAPPQMRDHVDELAGLATGESRSYELAVTDTSVPLSITMVYHDFPGAGIVNQLNMTVTSPTGATLFPNGGIGVDTDNNVERVRQAASDVELGTYTITVNAPNVPQGPQPFAIATLAGGILVDRQPVDAMLVLDKSGSMAAPACPSGCSSKMQVLQDSVELFTQLWTAVAVPGDRLGVTYFSSNISEFVVSGDVLLDVLGNSPAIIVDVNSKTAGGTTAMGGGVQSAINRLTDPARPRGIVLFTDGMQNRNPMVVNVDDSPPAGAFHLEIADEPGRTDSNVPPTVPPARIDTALDISVNTIGIGATPPFVEMLTDIADETDSVSKLTTAPDNDLRRFFVEELINVLRSGSPQLIDYRIGTLRDDMQTEVFRVNASSRQVVLKLSWDRGRELKLEVFKDQKDVTGAAKVIKGPFYTILSFDKHRIEATGIPLEGNWTMRITGESSSRYEAAAIAKEPLLGVNVGVRSKTGFIGDPLLLQARLTVGRLPLDGEARVEARILSPRTGMGTLLSKFDMPRQTEIKSEPGATIGQVKLERLLLLPEFVKEIQPVEDRITLRDRGDGVYEVVYEQTKMAGIYTVEFIINGKSETAGAFSRTETASTALRVGPANPEASEITAKLHGTGGRRSVLLSIRPVDKEGNLLGPDYADRVRFLLNGKPASSTKDRGDGSYTARTLIRTGSDPMLEVQVAGQTILRTTLKQIVR